MHITTILFDLDGTLLPMDQDEFTKGYFTLLAKKLAPCGYEPEKLIASIWAGTAAMVANNGACSNEEAFWKKFTEIYGDKAQADRPLFDEFYEKDFQGISAFCGFNPEAAKTIQQLKQAGFCVGLATNPIFPAVATHTRIRFAGLKPSDFALCTTYENSRFCKPNPAYYQEIFRKLNVAPEECLMVGNDVAEDMVAGTLGCKVFLLTDCLINKEGADIRQFPNGSFPELLRYLRQEINPALADNA